MRNMHLLIGTARDRLAVCASIRGAIVGFLMAEIEDTQWHSTCVCGILETSRRRYALSTIPNTIYCSTPRSRKLEASEGSLILPAMGSLRCWGCFVCVENYTVTMYGEVGADSLVACRFGRRDQKSRSIATASSIGLNTWHKSSNCVRIEVNDHGQDSSYSDELDETWPRSWVMTLLPIHTIR